MKKMSPKRAPIQKNLQLNSAGFTLIEILIATVILAIGLLGMAGIQVSGMRGSHASFQRTEATSIAHNMAERILANPSAAQNDGATITDNQYSIMGGASINSVGFDCATVVTECQGGSTCSLTQLAAYDIKSWICGMPSNGGGLQGGISQRLSGASGTIECIDLDLADVDLCTAGSAHRITVSWTETSSIDGANARKSVVLNTIP